MTVMVTAKEIMADIERQARELMPANYGGVLLHVTDNLPKVRGPDRIVRFPAHPFICWLARFFPIDPYVECAFEQYEDRIMIVGDRVFCSHLQFEQIKRVFPQWPKN